MGKSTAVFLEELHFIRSGIRAHIVIITDAGFHAPWFKEVQRLGWGYIGRVRGIVALKREQSTQWTTVNELYEHANGSPQALGLATLGKEKKMRLMDTFI